MKAMHLYSNTQQSTIKKAENPKDFLPLSQRGLGVSPSRWEVKGVSRGIGTVRKGSFSPLIMIKNNQVEGCNPT